MEQRPERPDRFWADRTPEARAFRWLVLGVLALKVVYLAGYVTLPFLYGPLFDAQVYLLQARRVTEGRFGDATLLAFSPLYGYLLAALGAVRGSVLPVLLQLALGLGNLVLMRSLGARLLGARTGLLAALAYAGYGPLLQLESKLMSETLGLGLLLLTLVVLNSAEFSRARASACVGAGCCLGLALLARASLLPLVPGLLLVAGLLPDGAGLRDARMHATRARRALLLAGGLALVLGAHGGWTKLQSGLFVPVILVSETAARATQVGWEGQLSVFGRGGEEGVSAFSVVDQAARRLARRRRGEPEPEGAPFSLMGYLAQAPKKLALSLRDRETSFDYGFYGERSELGVLRVPPLSFGMLLVFGVLGAIEALRRGHGRALLPLAAVALGTLLTTTMFHPSTRYRLPLALALMPLAAYAWCMALETMPTRRVPVRVALYAVVALTFALAHQLRGLERPAMWELRVAEAAAEAGDPDTAHARIDAALAGAGSDAEVRARAAYVLRMLPAR